MGFWVAGGVIQFQRSLKGCHSLARCFPTSGSSNGTDAESTYFLCPGLLVQSQDQLLVSIPSPRLRRAASQMMVALMVNLTAMAQSRVNPSFPASDPSARFSSLLIHVLCAIFPQNRTLASELKTCSAGYPISVIFLVASWNSPATSWVAEAASPVILTFFKPNRFLK